MKKKSDPLNLKKNIKDIHLNKVLIYMSKKSWPILFCTLIYKTAQDFLDTQYLY